MTTIHRVAAVQAEPVWLDMNATVKKTVDLINEAAANGAELVAFPETWIPGYPVFLWSYPVYEQVPFVRRYHENSPTIDGPELNTIREAAKTAGITVVLGLAEREAGSLYMSQVVIGPEGKDLLRRRKLKPTHAERTLFGESDGSGIKVVESAVGRLGALNCFEHIQPLTKYAMYEQHEQVHVAGWPCLGINGKNPMLAPDAINSITKTYALEGSSFVLFASQIMSDEGALAFPTADGGPCAVYTGGGGYAAVYGPDSSLLSNTLAPDEEGIVYADIDLGDLAYAKNVVDPTGHYARPDVARLLLNTAPRRPVIHVGADDSDAQYAGEFSSFADVTDGGSVPDAQAVPAA